MKTLIWDFEGTLAYRPGGLWTPALMEIIHRADPDRLVEPAQIRPYLDAGLPWQTPGKSHPEIQSAEQWWQALWPVFQAAFEAAGFAPAQAQEMAGQVRFVFSNPAKWALYPDTLETLQELSTQGWRHVILSNHVPELGEVVQYLGLQACFVRVFNSAETGYEKPHPRAFEIALQALRPSDALCMLGDNPIADIQGARQVGLPAILVHNDSSQAEHACETLAQIPPMLASLFGAAHSPVAAP
ncbi:MAG: HAD family hydrolase [Chloroflexota bacterium]